MTAKENLYWNYDAETMPREKITELQRRRLCEIVRWSHDKNPLFQKKMKDLSAEPGDIKALDDLAKLPFISKDDFRDTYPLGMLCVPCGELREMHMSSGSTGAPVVMAYTNEDLDQWAECMARCLRMGGLNRGDAIQITPSFGLFNGGFGFYHGARKAGLFIIPTGSGNTPRQITLMKDFKVKGLMGVVSYAIRIMEVLEEQGSRLDDLKVGIFGAETFSDSMRSKIESGLNIKACDIYGMTETGGVGTTGMDCPIRNGIHVWEDHYIVEVVDPETGRPLPDGETGELVFTSLTRRAIPVIRLRTGDISRIISREPCACGRTHIRIAPITGRLDDMLIIKGVNIYPRQVEQALMEIPGMGNNYQIIIEEKDGIRDLRINVEVEEGVTGFVVEKHLKEALGFSPKGDIYKPGELPRQEGKAKRVFFEKS